jgi:hypothetical protein
MWEKLNNKEVSLMNGLAVERSSSVIRKSANIDHLLAKAIRCYLAL